MVLYNYWSLGLRSYVISKVLYGCNFFKWLRLKVKKLTFNFSIRIEKTENIIRVK